jgi:hypothetical protein
VPKKNGLKLAPYDQRGNLMGYASEYMDNIDWQENKPFWELFTLVDVERGRSAAKFILEDGQGHQYPMFLSSALLMMQKCNIIEGAVSANWMVVKRGSNFGLEPLV